MNYAVLIGINSYKQVRGLSGCVNDVEDIADRLSSSDSLPSGNITKLLDSAATKAAICAAIEQAVSKLKFGDRLYIHFSGHGALLPTSDGNEPDGLDEVWCAYDFDWTPATAVTDNEVNERVQPRAPGSEVVETIDCCNSGDQTRALSPLEDSMRTLAPPPHLQAEIMRRRGLVRSFRAMARSPGICFLSACSPWQLAADTSFNGRANGAFTYHFLRAEQAHTPATLAELCETLKSELSRYDMTPVFEGELAMTWRAKATRSMRRSVDARPSLALARGSAVLLDRTFEASFAGHRGALQIRITADNGQILLYPLLSLLGAPIAVPPLALAGNQQIDVPIGGVLSARLVMGVSSWVMSPGTVRFDLDVSLATSMWFVPPVHICRFPVSLQLDQLTRRLIPALSSPADLVALLTLNRAQNSPSSVMVSSPAVREQGDSRSILEKVRNYRGRNAGVSRIEFNYFTCIGAEAVFGDTISIKFRGEPVTEFVVNNNDSHDIRASNHIPVGGGELLVEQYYFGQRRQPILRRTFTPADGPGEITYDIAAGEDGDPGGTYRFSLRLE